MSEFSTAKMSSRSHSGHVQKPTVNQALCHLCLFLYSNATFNTHHFSMPCGGAVNEQLLKGTNQVKMRVATQKVSSQLGPGTTWAQRGNMWWGSVTLRVKGKAVPRDVTRVRSRITQDEVKSGVNLWRTGKERLKNPILRVSVAPLWMQTLPEDTVKESHLCPQSSPAS